MYTEKGITPIPSRVVTNLVKGGSLEAIKLPPFAKFVSSLRY